MTAYDTRSEVWPDSKYAAISAFIFLRSVRTNIKIDFYLTKGAKLHFSCCGLPAHDRYWNTEGKQYGTASGIDGYYEDHPEFGQQHFL